MTLDELSIRFTADISAFSAAMASLTGLIGAANAQVDGMAAHFQAAGASAGAGLSSGILSQQGVVAAAARTLAAAASAALRGALQIHSPSRVTFEAGALFDEGLLQGIAGSAGKVEKAAGLVGDQAAQALEIPDFARTLPLPVQPAATAASAPPSGESAPISISIPLEVDGYQLGVAAIEGINRVTNGSGRIELQF